MTGLPITSDAVSGRRVFPAARLLTSAAPRSDQWFAARRRGITATDVVAILRLTDYGNALSVWLDKRGQLPPGETGEAATWGALLEDIVAREWARRYNIERGADVGIRRIGVVFNDSDPWMIASVDRRVTRCPDGPSCVLEVKTRSAYTRSDWRDGIPDDVLAQVLWQLMVTGVDHAHVAVLVGGQTMLMPDPIRVADEPEVCALLREEAWRVMCAVGDGAQPDVPADQVLADLLDRVYTARSGNVVVEVDPATAAIRDYVTAGATEKAAASEKAAARARLVALLGDAEAACVDPDGKPLWTYRRPAASRKIDLKAMQAQDPDLYAEALERFGADTAPSPRIHVTAAGKDAVAALAARLELEERTTGA